MDFVYFCCHQHFCLKFRTEDVGDNFSDMDKELIVKTSRSNLLLMYGVGGCEIVFLIYLLWGLYEEDSNGLDFFCLILGLFIFGGLYLIIYAYIVKDDYICVNSKGISIDAHNRDFIPKRCMFSYGWSELSTYVLDVVWRNHEPYFYLELYDKKEDLIQKIKLQSLLGAELENFDAYVPDDIVYKPAYDYLKYGRTTFCSRSNNSKILLFLGSFILLAAIAFFVLFFKIADDGLGAELCMSGIFFIYGLVLIYGGVVTKKDLLIFEENGLTIDLHTTSLFRHKYKVLSFDSFNYYKVLLTSSQCELNFYDKDENEIFSCDCIKLANARYLEWMLRWRLSE